MSKTTGFSHHAAGGVYGDGPVDLPIEPLVRETPDEFRARMDAKREAAAAARLRVAASDPRTPAPLPVGPVPTPRPRPPRAAPAPAARRTRSDKAVIVTAYALGDSIPQIAAATGHTRRTVTKALVDAGVQLRDGRATTSGNAAKDLRDEIAAAGLTSATLRAWALEHHIDVTHKGIPSRAVLEAYLGALYDDRVFEEPERRHVDVSDMIAANPSIGHTIDPNVLAAAIAADPGPTAPFVAERVPTGPEVTTPAAAVSPEPTLAAKVTETVTAAGIHIQPWQRRLVDALYPEPDDTANLAFDRDVPPLVIALAEIGVLADELAVLRPRLTARGRRTVDAALVALGTPDTGPLLGLFKT